MATGVYAITNTLNGNKYIGSAVDIKSRWRVHTCHLNSNKHHSPYLQRAWNKYGKDCFEFTILECCEKEQLIEREQFYIDSVKPSYNITQVAGSPLGVKRSKETKLRISMSKSGENCSAETRTKLSEVHKGKPSPRKGAKLSEETRAKISAAQKGRVTSEETRAKMRASSRHQAMPPEHYTKLSALYTGKPLSEEHRIKLSIAHMGNQSALGHKLPDELKEQMSVAAKLRWQRMKGI